MSKINKLRKGDVLGSGAYGKVYEAESQQGRRFAVKRILVDDSGDNFIDSLREADIVSRFVHPHIIRTSVQWGSPFGTPLSPTLNGYKDDSISFVMEIAKGDAKAYKNGTGYNIMDIKTLMVHGLLGLEYLHHNKVTHQDIKTQNILYCDTEYGPVFKISDLGLAYWNNKFGYRAELISTSWYRAPEIVRNNVYGTKDIYDTKVDIWSMGCVMFEFLMGYPLMRSIDRDDNTLISAEMDKLIPNYRQGGGPIVTWDMFWRKHKCNIMDEIPQYRSFLESMLEYDPSKRKSATELLSHPFLLSHQHYIATVRLKHPLQSDIYPLVDIPSTQERVFACNTAVNIINNRPDLVSDNYRTLFHALRLFETYISYQVTNIPRKYDHISANNGHYWSYGGCVVRFMTCFYIMNKYFSLLKKPHSWDSLLEPKYKTEEYMKLAKDTEKFVVAAIFKYNVYSHTVIDVAGHLNIALTDDYIKQIFMTYIKHQWINISVYGILQHCINIINTSLKKR